MLVRKKDVTTEKKEVKALTLLSLVESLEEFRKLGYFYFNQLVVCSDEAGITMGKEREKLCLPPEWNAKNIKEKNIAVVGICFKHILTNKEKYLFIQDEMFEGEMQTVIWTGDGFADEYQKNGRIDYAKDMPVLFEEILQRCEMKIVPGKIYQLDLECFKDTIQDSLFAFLYRHHYRQRKEGKVAMKEEKKAANSFAWAGEFLAPYKCWDNCMYAEIMIYHRESKEWEYFDDNLKRVWSEEMTDVYVARCEESLTEVGPFNEIKIPLKLLSAGSEMDQYLEGYRFLDFKLKCCE